MGKTSHDQLSHQDFPCFVVGLLLLVGSTVVGGCSGSNTVPDNCDPTPVKGEPAAFTLAGQTVGGVAVSAPKSCKEGAYIALDGDGPRKLVLARDVGHQIPECAQPPDDAQACPNVQVDYFAKAVAQRLREADIEVLGAGLGPCGDIDGSYDEWNFAFGVNDWAQADAAVRIVAEEMRRWQIGNRVGVAVQAIPCAVLL